jgi:signal transduction histidine kinase
LQIEPANEAIEVHLAEGEVKQILYNLVRNAIQASPTGDVVELRIRQHDSGVIVKVTDRGPGIAEEIAHRIFDPFFTTKHGESEPGMGLGLSVSRSLIEAMGGWIEVSHRSGGGTAFSAVFPRRLEVQGESTDE